VRRGFRALLEAVASKAWGKRPQPQRFEDEALIMLALYSHARIAKSALWYDRIEKNLGRVFESGRISKIFSRSGAADLGKDGTRLLYLLLYKQVQIARANLRPGLRDKAQIARIPWIDPRPMRLWLRRCRVDKSLSAERLLLRFLGTLILDPPRQHALKAPSTAILWKRAHIAMALERERSGRPIPARLRFLDNLLRNEFLTGAYPQQLRARRKKEVSAWSSEWPSPLTEARGLSEEDLYRLLIGPIVYNYSRWWE